MITHPASDEAFIRMARSKSHSYAQMVILHSEFQGILRWVGVRACKVLCKIWGGEGSRTFVAVLRERLSKEEFCC